MNNDMLNNINYSKNELDNINNWAAAIGLQQVDGLTPSKFLQILANKNINGLISNDQLEQFLSRYYQVQDLSNKELRNKMECDIVSNRIVEYLNSNASFNLYPDLLKEIHGYLFKDVYIFAGKYRECNLTKNEAILNGDTVIYADYRNIEEYLDYDFNTEIHFDYNSLPFEQRIKHLAKFIRNVWQTHPFREGNTRTISVFLIKYLKSKGYNVDNKIFLENAVYFRNALARSDYKPINEQPTLEYLIKFLENLILNSNNELNVADQIIGSKKR